MIARVMRLLRSRGERWIFVYDTPSAYGPTFENGWRNA